MLDPADPAPVGLNPLADRRAGAGSWPPTMLLSVFKALYAADWGHAPDILHACLLTLARRSDTTLVRAAAAAD